MALCEPNTDDVWAPMSSAIGQHTLQSPRTPRSRSAPPRPHGTSSEQLHKFDEEGAHQQKRKFNVHHASGSGRVMKEKAFSEDAPTAAPVRRSSIQIRNTGADLFEGAGGLTSEELGKFGSAEPGCKKTILPPSVKEDKEQWEKAAKDALKFPGRRYSLVNPKIVLKPPDNNTNKHMRGLHVEQLVGGLPADWREDGETYRGEKSRLHRAARRGAMAQRARQETSSSGRTRATCAASSSRRSS